MKWKLILATAIVGVGLAFPSPSSAAQFAYVTNRGGDSVSQYGIGTGGLLAPLSPFTVGARRDPEGVVVSPDGQSVYVANSGVLVDEPDDQNASVSQYDIAANGTLSPKSPPFIDSCGSMADHLAVSPDGKSLYVGTGDDCDLIDQYDIAANGTLSPKSPAFVEATGPDALAVSPDSRSVYATGMGGRVVFQYDAGGDGTLSPKSPPSVTVGSEFRFLPDIDVSPDGRSVYVTEGTPPPQGGSSVGSVLQYNVGSGGQLSPKSPAAVPTGHDPAALAVSPNGTSAYVVSISGGSIFQYNVNPANGALSPKTPATVPAGVGPTGITVSADGRNVYVANTGRFPRRGYVSQYNVGPGGRLSAKSPATVSNGGFDPVGIAMSPAPTTKALCKHGGWRQFGSRNQGQCIRFVKHGPKH